MGFIDTIKERFANRGKAEEMAGQHGDKIDEGIDKAGRTADDRTGGKHGDRIRGATDTAKDRMKDRTDGGDR